MFGRIVGNYARMCQTKLPIPEVARPLPLNLAALALQSLDPRVTLIGS